MRAGVIRNLGKMISLIYPRNPMIRREIQDEYLISDWQTAGSSGFRPAEGAAVERDGAAEEPRDVDKTRWQRW